MIYLPFFKQPDVRKNPNIQWYGWKPSKPDFRDFKFTPEPRVLTTLPPSVSPITKPFIPAYNQAELGSCTANGGGRLIQYVWKTQGDAWPIPSRLFIYYYERVLEGTINEDSGAAVRDCFKAVNRWGVCPEKLWWYDINKFTIRPDRRARKAALDNIATSYYSVSNDLAHIKTALASGHPVVGGFTVFSSFESDIVAKTGIMPMPRKNESAVGGHCVVWDGYQDDSSFAGGGYFWCANSWDIDWGIDGWFKMPYANLVNCDDFWVLLKTT